MLFQSTSPLASYEFAMWGVMYWQSLLRYRSSVKVSCTICRLNNVLLICCHGSFLFCGMGCWRMRSEWNIFLCLSLNSRRCLTQPVDDAWDLVIFSEKSAMHWRWVTKDIPGFSIMPSEKLEGWVKPAYVNDSFLGDC